MTLDMGQNQTGVYLDTAGTTLAVTVTASLPTGSLQSASFAGTFFSLSVNYADSALGLAGLPTTTPQPGSSNSSSCSAGLLTLQIAPSGNNNPLVPAAMVVNSTPTSDV